MPSSNGTQEMSSGKSAGSSNGSSSKNYPQDNADADSPLYKSDEFRMYCFKVLPCSKRYCHDWTTCFFCHPAEKAKRRDPRMYTYTGIACPEMKKNLQCPRGDSCPYAHNVFEYWLHPSRYRSQLCNDGTCCKRKVCFFAHAIDELRVPSVEPLSQELAAHLAAQGLPAVDDASENPFMSMPKRGPARSTPTLTTATAPNKLFQHWSAQQQLSAGKPPGYHGLHGSETSGVSQRLAQLAMSPAPLHAAQASSSQAQLLVDHVSSSLALLQSSLPPGAITQQNMSDVVSVLVQQAMADPALAAQQRQLTVMEAQTALLRQADMQRMHAQGYQSHLHEQAACMLAGNPSFLGGAQQQMHSTSALASLLASRGAQAAFNNAHLATPYSPKAGMQFQQGHPYGAAYFGGAGAPSVDEAANDRSMELQFGMQHQSLAGTAFDALGNTLRV